MNPNPYIQNIQKDMSLIDVSNVVLVAVCYQDPDVFYYQLSELKSLCEACNFECVETITQNQPNIVPQTYIGSGKLLEVKNVLEALNVDKVVFNDELTPSQIKNISEVLGDNIEIIDRTMLILEIFEKRATSKEATLQVEVAKLKYMLPRLIGTRKYMSRTTGNASGKGATRGLGETKLELDRRHIENKINKATKELKEIKLQRLTTRKMRNVNNIKTVAFVGYTNAGKSSTINALLKLYGEYNDEKEVFVKDMLFATLDTQTRKIKLPNNHSFLITDTVGFVSKLPHHLVESFKSTLEEIKEADLIIHIVDANSPFLDLQINTTLEVLKSLDVDNIPILTVFNKYDLVKNPVFLKDYEHIELSAKFKVGFRKLVDIIDQTLFDELYLDTFLIPYSNGQYVSLIQNEFEVLNIEYLNEGTKITSKVSEKIHNMLSKYIVK